MSVFPNVFLWMCFRECVSNLLLVVSSTSLYFYFDQQGGEVPKTVKKLKAFEFFCWLISAKLIFVTPKVPYVPGLFRKVHTYS